LIVDWSPIDEEFEGWETLDFMFASCYLMDSGVQFSDNNVLSSVFMQLFGKACVTRSHLFTVSTPWGVEFNEDEFVGSDEIFKVLICEDYDVGVFFDAESTFFLDGQSHKAK